MAKPISPYDHFSLDEITEKAIAAFDEASKISPDMTPAKVASAERRATVWLGVLQARATQEAALSSRRLTLWLVVGTWALVAATIVLAVASG
jgi:hypothetical protein